MTGQRLRFPIWKLMATIAVFASTLGTIMLAITDNWATAILVIFVMASSIALSIHFWICSLIDAAEERRQQRDSEYWEWRRGQ